MHSILTEKRQIQEGGCQTWGIVKRAAEQPAHGTMFFSKLSAVEYLHPYFPQTALADGAAKSINYFSGNPGLKGFALVFKPQLQTDLTAWF
jgi:hypothetical protein